MKKALLKKTGEMILCLGCLAVVGSAFAQAQNPPYVVPKTAAVAPPNIVPPTPRTPLWPYNLPSPMSQATPTIDENGAYYLPFLPWAGQNIALLANYADFFFQLEKDKTSSDKTYAFDSAGTMAANNILSQTADKTMQEVSKKTLAQYQQQMGFFPNIQALANYAAIPGTDITIPCQPNAINCRNPTNAAFNADNLLSSTGYNADEGKDIDTLIVFLSNLTQSFPSPGFKQDDSADTRAKLLQRGDVQSYILSIRTLGSLQSMALSNFNFLAQERQITPGLGDQVGMKTFPPFNNPNAPSTPIHDASQLQVEKYLIDRRLNNPAWYTAINTATSIAIQRETLFALMEMQRQIYESRMLNERMLATLSSMQMTMLQMSKSSIQVQAQNINAALAQSNNP